MMMLTTSHGALQPVEDRFFPRVGLRSPDYDDDDDDDGDDNDGHYDDDNVCCSPAADFCFVFGSG